MWYYWLFLVILLAIIEISTNNMVTIWYILSAFVALILSFFVDSFVVLFFIFVVLGTILLITTKPILDKRIKIKKEKTNLDKVVGMTGITTLDISPNKNGEVLVDGKRWTAFSEEQIKINEKVVVLEIQGVKLKVRREE